jgi:hypothetical protein
VGRIAREVGCDEGPTISERQTEEDDRRPPGSDTHCETHDRGDPQGGLIARHATAPGASASAENCGMPWSGCGLPPGPSPRTPSASRSRTTRSDHRLEKQSASAADRRDRRQTGYAWRQQFRF